MRFLTENKMFPDHLCLPVAPSPRCESGCTFSGRISLLWVISRCWMCGEVTLREHGHSGGGTLECPFLGSISPRVRGNSALVFRCLMPLPVGSWGAGGGREGEREDLGIESERGHASCGGGTPRYYYYTCQSPSSPWTLPQCFSSISPPATGLGLPMTISPPPP